MHGRSWRNAGLALAALLIGGPAAAQSPLGEAPTIRPGGVGLDGTRVQPGVWEVRYFRVSDGKEQEIGLFRRELDVVRKDGETLLRSVEFMNSPRGSGVDTVTAVRATLQPRVHRGHHAGSTLSLDFSDGTVSGRATKSGEAPVEQKHALEDPLFDANLLDIVLGSLPLDEGLHVRIPMYVFEKKGAMWFEARVVGQENVTIDGVAAPAWAVAITFEQGSGTFYIDSDSRQFVKAVLHAPDGSELRMVRRKVTPPA